MESVGTKEDVSFILNQEKYVIVCGRHILIENVEVLHIVNIIKRGINSMRKKILLCLIVASITFVLCSCGNSIDESDTILTDVNENENTEELNAIDKSEDLIPSSWAFYEENDTIPTPDSTVNGIMFREKSDDNYMYDLSDNSYDANMNFKAYGAVLLGCGLTIENEDSLYKILDDSGEIVAAMGTGKEDDSYFLMIYIW